MSYDDLKVINRALFGISLVVHQMDYIFSEDRYTLSMPAVLEFDSVRITVPISELGAAVLELRRIGLIPARFFGTQAVGSEKNVGPLPVAEQISLGLGDDMSQAARFAGRVPRRAADIKAARNFLAMVAKLDSHKGRAEASSALDVFDVKHSKGLGSKLAVVNRLLDAAGFAIPDVYTTERDAHGSFWRAGSRIADAISAVAVMAVEAEESERADHELAGPPHISNEEDDKEVHVQPQHNEKSP